MGRPNKNETREATKTLSYRLSISLAEALEVKALEMNTNPSNLVANLVTNFLKNSSDEWIDCNSFNVPESEEELIEMWKERYPAMQSQ